MGTKPHVLGGAVLLGLLAYVHGTRIECIPMDTRTVYDFNATNIYENETISLSRYQGKVLAVMNTATYWGLTIPHYVGMNALMDKYSSLGFEGLGFPSNDFHLQEPSGSYTELLNGLKYVRPGDGYVPNFQMFKKIDVNGEDQHPLYKYMKKECSPTSEDFQDSLFYKPLSVSDVRWNFEIFLINKLGHPVYRFSPDAPLSDVEADIKAMLKVGGDVTEEETETEEPRPIVESQDIVQEPETEEEEQFEENYVEERES